jgi:signal peptidase I
MACLIISESYDFPVDFWNYEKFHEKNTSRRDNKRKSNGSFIKIGGEIFILTCYHCIEDNNVKNIIYYYDNNDILQESVAHIKYSLCEFDIAVLKPEKQINNVKSFDTNDTLYKLDEITKENMNIITICKQKERIEIKNIDIKCAEIKREKFIDGLVVNYKIPSIHFKLKTTENIELEGTSGSILYKNNIPVGIIYSMDTTDNVISAFPYCLCIELLKSGMNKKKYISSLMLSYNLCEIEFEKDEKIEFDVQETKDIITDFMSDEEKIIGLYLNNTFNMTYQKISNNKTLSNFKFTEKDIILAINARKIDSNGMIYCNILDYNIDVFTYCLLFSYINDSIQITFMRKNSIFTIKLVCKKLNDIFSFHIKKFNSYVEYDGFVFSELSSELLKYYKTKNISLYGDIKKIKDDKINKYVVLVHVDYEYLRKNYKNNDAVTKLENLNFPHVNNKILLLNKIGNDNINDLNSLRKILAKKKFDKQATFCYNIYNQLNLNTESHDSYDSTMRIETNSNFIQHIKYFC